MFGQPGYSRTLSANVREIERRLRSMEKRLERAGVRTSASAVETAEHVGETVAAVLSSIADRFRGGANSMGDEAAKKSAARRRSLATMPCAAFRRKSGTARLSRSQLQSAWEFLWAWSVTVVDGPSGCQRISRAEGTYLTKARHSHE